MTLRFAVGGFLHESHSFAPHPAAWQDFVHPGGFPGLVRGPALLPALRGTATALAGALTEAEAHGATIAPLLWCAANPAGPVQDSAFERIAALLCAELSDALADAPLDGVFLDLHGAALTPAFPDAEGELLRRVRRILGDVPLAISLDPHANLTAAMVAGCDVAVPYRTYPHVDMRETGARAIRRLLDRIRLGRPLAKAFRQLDYWIPLPSQCTLDGPMHTVLQRRAAIAAEHGVAELAFCFGFPYADFADTGVAVAAYAEHQDDADCAADGLMDVLADLEPQFVLDVLPAAEAVADALRHPGGTVIIADTQDNPGGGGHGDTTGLLACLVDQRAVGAVLCLINDAETAAACHAAGEGADVELALGGKSDGAPLHTPARVLKLTDGRFALTGPMAAGNHADLGATALIEIPPGIQVMVVSRKMQAYDQAMLRHVGIEPAEVPILALKSSVHFRADFAPIAARILVATAPGPVVADPSTLTFAHLRPGLRLRPRR